MDLRPYALTTEQALRGTGLFDYQPFILSDTIRTGAAYHWMYPEKVAASAYRGEPPRPWIGDASRMSAEDWQCFCQATDAQRRMYEDWIDAVCRFLPNVADLTVADVACNSGYFPVSFSLRGAREAHGYDMTDHGPAFEFLNAVTGSQAVFRQASYNSMTHSIEGMGAYDVVFATAIVEHVSDPLHFLAFLSSVCSKLLFLFLPTLETKELAVVMNDTRSVHVPDAPFPVCFDGVRLSVPLVYKSLELCGFRHVVELHRRDHWVPLSFYRNRRVFIALR